MAIQIIEVEIPVAGITEIEVNLSSQPVWIISSATPPANPTAGMQWFDTTTGILSVWYVDAWVAFTGQGPQGETGGPGTPAETATLLGIPSYASLVAANAALPIGSLFLNTGETPDQLQITTA